MPGIDWSSPWPCLELVIDQNEGRGIDVIDSLNETLRSLEQAGVITGWTWGPVEVVAVLAGKS